MGFANPVAGTIHPASWQRPPGSTEFEVTSPFGPRVLVIGGKRVGSIHKGLDLGNARRGSTVYAQAAGTVVECRPTLDGVVTIQTADGWRLVAAHMTNITVRLGAKVPVGYPIGKVGDVGAPGQPHVHIENLKRTLGIWRAQDPWPLLAQNQEDDSLTIVDRFPFPEGTRTWTAKGGSTTGWKPTGESKVVNLGAGSQAEARATANITQDPQKAPNGHGFVEIANGTLAGWLVLPTAGTLEAPPPDIALAKCRADLAAATAAVAAAANSVAAAAVTEAKNYG